jgi:hypothetical protein
VFSGQQDFGIHDGDCAYFDSTMGHALISNGPGDAKVLWVCTHIQLE